MSPTERIVPALPLAHSRFVELSASERQLLHVLTFRLTTQRAPDEDGLTSVYKDAFGIRYAFNMQADMYRESMDTECIFIINNGHKWDK